MLTRPLLGLLTLGLPLAAAGTSAAGAQPVPPLERDATVAAPIEEVWNALATPDGVRTFFAAAARVEPKIGGAYEMYFLLDGPPGQRGGEGLHFLDLEPPHRFLIEWNAPPTFGELRDIHTWVEVTLREKSPSETTVHLVHGGFGDAAAGWTAVHDYFVGAWEHVLASLTKRFAEGPRDWTAERGADFVAAAAKIQAEIDALDITPKHHWLIELAPATPTLAKGEPTPEEAAIVQAHFERLKRLHAQGWLILGGPTMDTPPTGLVVFRAPDEAAARAVLAGDPAVRAGLMTGRVRPFALALLGR